MDYIVYNHYASIRLITPVLPVQPAKPAKPVKRDDYKEMQYQQSQKCENKASGLEDIFVNGSTTLGVNLDIQA